MKSRAAMWLRFSPKRATTPAATGSVLLGRPRRKARSATGSTSRNAKKPRKWASACSKTKRVTSAAASRKFPKPTSSSSFRITAFPRLRISTPPSVSGNIPPARSSRAFSENRKNPPRPRPSMPSPLSSRPSNACWVLAKRRWSSRAMTICSFIAPNVAIPFPATKLSATSRVAAVSPCTPGRVPTCRISCTRPNAASPSSGAADPKPNFPSSSPSARGTAPVFLLTSPPSSAEPVPTFTTSKAVPIAPTRALTPTSKLPTGASSKPFSSISARFPAFSASNASTSPATRMSHTCTSRHAVFSAAKILFQPWAFSLSRPPVLSPGISQSTLFVLPLCSRYNGAMRYRLMTLGVLVLFRMSGCHQHPLTDYRPLDQAGMWSSNVEQLKTLNTSDREVAQLVKLKQAGIGDDACVTLISGAHQRQHPFTSADSAVNLVRAGYTESVILEIAKTDQLDLLGGDAVMLRLISLSDSAIDLILHRRLKGQPTMSSAEIGRLKNTGLTEKQILERINQGMTDAQADKEASLREATRNHANTGFVRTHGRRSR